MHKSLSSYDCHFCEDVTQIERSADLNPQIIADQFIQNDIPLILSPDEVKSQLFKWPIASNDFDLRKLEEVKMK